MSAFGSVGKHSAEDLAQQAVLDALRWSPRVLDSEVPVLFRFAQQSFQRSTLRSRAPDNATELTYCFYESALVEQRDAVKLRAECEDVAQRFLRRDDLSSNARRVVGILQDQDRFWLWHTRVERLRRFFGVSRVRDPTLRIIAAYLKLPYSAVHAAVTELRHIAACERTMSMRIPVEGVAKTCREIEEATGWSQAVAAVKTGISPGLWNKFINAKGVVTMNESTYQALRLVYRNTFKREAVAMKRCRKTTAAVADRSKRAQHQ